MNYLDINEDMRNKREQLRKIQESTPLEKYEKIRSQLKSDEHLIEASKGQLISKCPFGVFKSPKKPMKFFPGFLPSL